jgi:hypothetical protein
MKISIAVVVVLLAVGILGFVRVGYELKNGVLVAAAIIIAALMIVQKKEPDMKKLKPPLIIIIVLGTVLGGAGSGIAVSRARQVLSDTGQGIGNVKTFSVDDYFEPTGKMGDIGDVRVEKQEGFVRFVYEAAGRGPHMWGYRYVEGKENPLPAQFGGVMYLNPSENWGTDPDGGYDLRSCHSAIKWEAHSVDGDVSVDFVMGGRKRDLTTKEAKPFPYPNTIDQSLRTETLKSEWKSFEYDLSKLQNERFKRVVGGFGWTINWSSNGIRPNKQQTGPETPRTFTIEIRNIQYDCTPTDKK